MKKASAGKWRAAIFAPARECLFLRSYRHLVNQHRNACIAEGRGRQAHSSKLPVTIPTGTFLTASALHRASKSPLPASRAESQPTFSCSSRAMECRRQQHTF